MSKYKFDGKSGAIYITGAEPVVYTRVMIEYDQNTDLNVVNGKKPSLFKNSEDLKHYFLEEDGLNILLDELTAGKTVVFRPLEIEAE